MYYQRNKGSQGHTRISQNSENKLKKKQAGYTQSVKQSLPLCFWYIKDTLHSDTDFEWDTNS